MKRVALVGTVLAVAIAALPSSAGAARVMTWNIKDRGEGPAEADQITKAAELIASARPNVLGLQEVCVEDADNLVAVLRGQHGLRYYEQPGSVEDEGMGCARGQAILSRRPISGWNNVVWAPADGDRERRGYMFVDTTLNGRPVRVYNTHIGLWSSCTQRAAVNVIARRAARHRRSVVLGDLNVNPGTACGTRRVIGPLVARFREVDRLRNRTTRPGSGKIDYVFTRGLRNNGAVVLASPASDHHALMGFVSP